MRQQVLADGGNALRRAARHMRWFAREAMHQFVRHDCLNGAAALTFTTLLALVPLMTVTYVVLSAFPELQTVGKAAEAFLFEHFLPQASEALVERFAQFSARATGLGILSFGMLLLTAFLALVRIESVFNAIWGVPAPRAGLQRLLVYWAALTFGPPLLIAALLATSYLYALPLISDLDAWGLREQLLSAAPNAAIAATFTFLYYAVPNTRVAFSHALLGGGFTMLLFELAKQGFAEFVARSATATIYGAFAAAPLFLMWLYVVWTMALGGAVFARTLSLPRAAAQRSEPRLLQCVRALALLRAAHARGEAVAAAKLGAACSIAGEAEREAVLQALADERLVRQTADGRLALGRSLQTVTLLDLHRRLPEAFDLEHLDVDGLPAATRRVRAVAEFGARELNVSVEDLLAENDRRAPAAHQAG